MVLNAKTSYPHSRIYVLRLHRDAIPRQGRIFGRLEHVASGHQFHFSSGEELLACLTKIAGLPEPAVREGDLS